MKTFFTADTHFSHARIIELCDRPFSGIEEMDEAILDGINSTVTEKDRLVILGDICLGKLENSLQNLAKIRAAELVLIPGNHDRWSLAYHHRGETAEEKREAFRIRYTEQRENTLAFADNEPSSWTWPMLVWDDDRKHDEPLNTSMTLFSHYPYEGDSHGEDRCAFLREEDKGLPVIHGHVHTEWRVRGRQFNVGVDVNDFKPVSEVELADWVRSLKE